MEWEWFIQLYKLNSLWSQFPFRNLEILTSLAISVVFRRLGSLLQPCLEKPAPGRPASCWLLHGQLPTPGSPFLFLNTVLIILTQRAIYLFIMFTVNYQSLPTPNINSTEIHCYTPSPWNSAQNAVDALYTLAELTEDTFSAYWYSLSPFSCHQPLPFSVPCLFPSLILTRSPSLLIYFQAEVTLSY